MAPRCSRKALTVVRSAAFDLGSVSVEWSTISDDGIGARFLQGVAGGVMLICQVAILSHQFQDARARSSSFAWWGVIFGIGLGFGPIIGSGIVAVAGGEWVFLVHVALALVTFTLGLIGVRESKDPQASRLDIAGTLTLSTAVLTLTAFITEGPRLGFASPLALAILATSVVGLIAFVVVERRVAQAASDPGDTPHRHKTKQWCKGEDAEQPARRACGSRRPARIDQAPGIGHHSGERGAHGRGE
jgi:hypothetical protein